MSAVESAVQQLRDNHAAKQWDKCIQAVPSVKLQLLQAASTQIPRQQSLALSREILEIAVLASAQMTDEGTFARNFAQLRALYFDTRSILPPSQNEALMTGLNLLRLLADNRIAEFHTELEIIPQQVQQEPCVAYVVQLEQWLMEGTYNHVLAARDSSPSESFQPFLEQLATTVRLEIASCSEHAYTSLSVDTAQSLLLIPTTDETHTFAFERNWDIEDERLQFPHCDTIGRGNVNALEVITNSMTYARELERIV